MDGTRRHASRASAGPTEAERAPRRRSRPAPLPARSHRRRRQSDEAAQPDRAGGGRGGGHRDRRGRRRLGVGGQRDVGRAADRRGGAGQRRLIAQPGLGLRGPGRDRGGHAVVTQLPPADTPLVLTAEDHAGLPGRGRRLRRPGPAHHLAAGRRQGQLRPGPDGAGQARVRPHATPRGTFQVSWKAGPELRQRHLQRADAVGHLLRPRRRRLPRRQPDPMVARLRAPHGRQRPLLQRAPARSAPKWSSSSRLSARPRPPAPASSECAGARPTRASWSAKCGLAGSPDAPPGITKLAEPAVGEVHHLPVDRQAGRRERSARPPAVPGRLDGVGVAAHRHRVGGTAWPGRAGAPGPPGGRRPTATARGPARPLDRRRPRRGERGRDRGEHPPPPLARRARSGPCSRRHRTDRHPEQLPGVVAEPPPDHGHRRRERARRDPVPGIRAEHRPVQLRRERPDEARVQQRRGRLRREVPVEPGQQRPRRLGVRVALERPERAEQPAPSPAPASETVSACIPASASTVSAARPSSSDRSRSARNGCANVYDR